MWAFWLIILILIVVFLNRVENFSTAVSPATLLQLSVSSPYGDKARTSRFTDKVSV